MQSKVTASYDKVIATMLTQRYRNRYRLRPSNDIHLPVSVFETNVLAFRYFVPCANGSPKEPTTVHCTHYLTCAPIDTEAFRFLQ
jgi:hypothetical protein